MQIVSLTKLNRHFKKFKKKFELMSSKQIIVLMRRVTRDGKFLSFISSLNCHNLEIVAGG